MAAALVVALIVGFLALRDTSSPGDGSDATARFEHVHGVGLNPGENVVYAGTHHGLFRLASSGAPALVAGRVQDFMGFTVVGPNHFLASGHPEEGSDAPSSLGLIESTDAGKTWTSLSLAGAADFHALQARHGRVYGYNSMTGALMVTADKKTWDTRTSLAMADFVVSPTDPDLLLATTEQGLSRSKDGGRSFAPAAAPELLLVSWPEEGVVVGITPQGVIQVSGDQGGSWQQRGTVDATPEALEAATGNDIHVAADGVVNASLDGGRTFTVLGGG